ncbi:MAG TPA: AMP-binding protein [Terriglobales bacterium]
MNSTASNVASFLLEGKEPTRVALRLIDADHTYGSLQSASLDIARCLACAGGRKGDRAILLAENSFFWVAAYLGILRSGLVCVPLPATTSGPELSYILQTTEPRFAFLQAKLVPKHRATLDGLSLVTDHEVADSGLRPVTSLVKIQSGVTPTGPALPAVARDDLAALMFTSGSTGRPHGVMVSHGNIIANTESIVDYLKLTDGDRMMTVLPFHYCFGTSLMHTHLRVGGSLVIDLRFMYPEVVLERMQDTECTGFAGVPSHFQILLRSSSLKSKTFPHLRYLQQAGGHLAPAFIRDLRDALPSAQVFVMYGQTEATARLAYLPPESLESKLGSIGKGIPGVRLRVLNESGDEVQRGEVGEIVAEGENITQGYWRAPEESAKCFRQGRLYTGDLATVDDEGFIYVVDRAKEFVKCGGRRVSCRQLEERLLEFDGLLEAAVVGVPDDILGEAVRAFVVPRKPDHRELEERLRLFCKAHMPYQLVPREFVIVDSLPKNSSGKVLRPRLKALPGVVS